MNNTGIDWFLPWPPQALHAVAQSFLGKSVKMLYIERVIESTIGSSLFADDLIFFLFTKVQHIRLLSIYS